MLNTYEFTTCFYILGGICATNCIFGLMFKPLPKTEVKKKAIYNNSYLVKLLYRMRKLSGVKTSEVETQTLRNS